MLKLQNHLPLLGFVKMYIYTLIYINDKKKLEAPKIILNMCDMSGLKVIGIFFKKS